MTVGSRLDRDHTQVIDQIRHAARVLSDLPQRVQ